MTLLKLEKVKVVRIQIIFKLSKKREGEYTDSFSHSLKTPVLATTWLNEKPQTTPFFIASAKQCLSNIPLFFMTILYVFSIGTSKMKNSVSDGNYTCLTFRI